MGSIVVISSSPSTISIQRNETTRIQEHVNSNAHDFQMHTIIRNSRPGVVRESIAMLCRCQGFCFPGIGGNKVTFTIDDPISKFARLVERVDGVETQIGSYRKYS